LDFEKMAYSRDFREKVLLIKEQDKLSFNKVAKRFDVGKASVIIWSNRIEVQKTRNKPTTKIDMERLKRDVQMHPDAYQYERAERFGVSQTFITAALRRLGITRKKKHSHILTPNLLHGVPFKKK
jgi:transposase